MRAVAVALPMLALALAGCTVEPPTLEGQLPRLPGAGLGAPGAGGPATPGNATNVSFAAPTEWEPRQWWRYRVNSGETQRVESRVAAVDLGAAWQVMTDSPETAYFDALFDISTVGRIRKADLAGEQRGATVDYYRFPMEANATWTTLWDGQQRTVRVVGPQTAIVGGQSFPAMALEATQGGQLAARYNYVPEVGWYSYFDFPVSGFRLELQAHGRAYNGTLAEARVAEVYRDVAEGPLKPQGDFSVDSGVTFLDVQGRFTGDAATYALVFRDPAGNNFNFQGPNCTSNCTVVFNATLNGTAGDWRVVSLTPVLGQQQPAHSELIVRAATITRRNAT